MVSVFRGTARPADWRNAIAGAILLATVAVTGSVGGVVMDATRELRRPAGATGDLGGSPGPERNRPIRWAASHRQPLAEIAAWAARSRPCIFSLVIV